MLLGAGRSIRDPLIILITGWEVLALFAALLILFLLPFTSKINKRGLIFYPINQLLF